ncbi:MAG: DUF4157 domain-containing protein, partial [Bacteroidota bacterium]
FGRNFNDVRIHDDSSAHDLSASIGAKAFTVGNDIFFGAGHFSPTTNAGQTLLAHELTHTVQQTGGETMIQRDPGDPDTDPDHYIRDKEGAKFGVTILMTEELIKMNLVQSTRYIYQQVHGVGNIDVIMNDILSRYPSMEGYWQPGPFNGFQDYTVGAEKTFNIHIATYEKQQVLLYGMATEARNMETGQKTRAGERRAEFNKLDPGRQAEIRAKALAEFNRRTGKDLSFEDLTGDDLLFFNGILDDTIALELVDMDMEGMTDHAKEFLATQKDKLGPDTYWKLREITSLINQFNPEEWESYSQYHVTINTWANAEDETWANDYDEALDLMLESLRYYVKDLESQHLKHEAQMRLLDRLREGENWWRTQLYGFAEKDWKREIKDYVKAGWAHGVDGWTGDQTDFDSKRLAPYLTDDLIAQTFAMYEQDYRNRHAEVEMEEFIKTEFPDGAPTPPDMLNHIVGIVYAQHLRYQKSDPMSNVIDGDFGFSTKEWQLFAAVQDWKNKSITAFSTAHTEATRTCPENLDNLVTEEGVNWTLVDTLAHEENEDRRTASAKVYEIEPDYKPLYDAVLGNSMDEFAKEDKTAKTEVKASFESHYKEYTDNYKTYATKLEDLFYQKYFYFQEIQRWAETPYRRPVLDSNGNIMRSFTATNLQMGSWWFRHSLNISIRDIPDDHVNGPAKMERMREIYVDAKGDLYAIARAYLLNQDPGYVEKEGFFGAMWESLLEATFYDDYITDKDFVQDFYTTLMEENLPITQAQKDNIKESFWAQAGHAVGASIPVMLEIAVTTLLTEGMGTIPAIARAGTLLRGAMVARWGRFGEKAYKVITATLKSTVAFWMAGAGAAAGFGEGLVSGLFSPEQFMANLLGKRNKYVRLITMFTTRVAVGALAETAAEYTGEYFSHIISTGFDYRKAFEKTFGRDFEEGKDKLLLTLFVSALFSSSSNGPNLVFNLQRAYQTSGNADPKDLTIVKNLVQQQMYMKQDVNAEGNMNVKKGEGQAEFDAQSLTLQQKFDFFKLTESPGEK